MTGNAAAFLRVIREGESNQTDDAYTIINGGAHFNSFADHPYAGQSAPPGKASGAYGYIPHTWARVAAAIGAPDFSPGWQDAGALYLIAQHGATAAVSAGDLAAAIALLSKEWVSLPGLGIERARRVFLEYGGAESSAPQTDAPQVVAVQTQPTGANVGAIAIPLLTQLLPQVLTLFSGRAQAQITKATGADPAAAGQFMQSLIAQIGSTVGVPVSDAATATQAVAAVTAQPAEQQAATVATLEKYSLDQLAPLLDKMHGYDKDLWTAQDTGKQAVSSIAIEEHKAGLWDMTQWVVVSLLVMLWGIAWGLLAAIVWLAVGGKADANPAMLTALIGLAGPIWAGAIVAGVAAIVAYRFDGTKESHAAAAAAAQIAGNK